MCLVCIHVHVCVSMSKPLLMFTAVRVKRDASVFCRRRDGTWNVRWVTVSGVAEVLVFVL